MRRLADPGGKQREGAVPYAANVDLPASVRLHLPEQAQDIFREAFNGAWYTYAARPLRTREEIAHRVAWAAVKKRYRKLGGEWARYRW
jgi:cation transport regulator